MISHPTDAIDSNVKMDHVSLLNSTGNQQIDDLLCGAIGVFESVFPRRIRGYYLVGSYRNGDAIPSSDLDVMVVFGGKLGTEEEQICRKLSNYCSLISPIRLEFLPCSEAQRFNGREHLLKCRSLLLLGEDIREAIAVQPPQDALALFPDYFGSLKVIRAFWAWPDILIYPVAYPDPDGEFYGYDLMGIKLTTWPEDDYAPGTRTLVAHIACAATVMVRMRVSCHIGSKREAIEFYRRYIGDEWTPLVEDVYAKCRGEWHYLIPEKPLERARLREFCKRTLAFENHVLAECRAYLHGKLRDDDEELVLLATELAGEAMFVDAETEAVLKLLESHDQTKIRRAAHESLKSLHRVQVEQ